MTNDTALEICSWVWLAWALIWLVSAFFTFKSTWRETYLQRQSHGFPTALALIAIFFAPLTGVTQSGQIYETPALLITGIALTMIGLGFAVWARWHLGRYWSGILTLKQNHRLIDTGPYRYVRHPIYTGILLAFLGSAMASATPWAFAAVPVVVATYVIKARREEKLLLGNFGEVYAQYMTRTAALFPYIY